jgi:hypothetical protein
MIPDGELLRSRVVTSLSPVLSEVLERRLDGYAVLSTPLGEDDDSGVVTFEGGVATLVYHAGTDRGGPPAIADLGTPPFHLELYELAADALDLPHRNETLSVSPGALAERLADDEELAAEIRTAATGEDAATHADLETFLDDEAAVEDVRRAAREDAIERADEWGFSDAIDRTDG